MRKIIVFQDDFTNTEFQRHLLESHGVTIIRFLRIINGSRYRGEGVEKDLAKLRQIKRIESDEPCFSGDI